MALIKLFEKQLQQHYRPKKTRLDEPNVNECVVDITAAQDFLLICFDNPRYKFAPYFRSAPMMRDYHILYLMEYDKIPYLLTLTCELKIKKTEEHLARAEQQIYMGRSIIRYVVAELMRRTKITSDHPVRPLFFGVVFFTDAPEPTGEGRYAIQKYEDLKYIEHPQGYVTDDLVTVCSLDIIGRQFIEDFLRNP